MFLYDKEKTNRLVLGDGSNSFPIILGLSSLKILSVINIAAKNCFSHG